MLYLDHAATTPVRPEVLEAMLPYLTDRFGNPSSHHTVGEAAAVLGEKATPVVADLGAKAGGFLKNVKKHMKDTGSASGQSRR